MSMGEVLTLSHNMPLIVVGEYHGNPGSMAFYDPTGFCVLSIYMSVLNSPSDYPAKSSVVPLISGNNELVPILSDLLFSDLKNEMASPLSLEINDDRMDFKENNTILFTLRLKSHMIFEGDETCL